MTHLGTSFRLKPLLDLTVTLEHLKPVLDGWAKDARAFFEAARARN